MPVEVERMNLKGLTAMTYVMAVCANKPLHVGAAYRWK